jgi:pyruvate dehydrogenase (quinone)
LKEAKAFATSLLSGDPEEGGVIRGTARQVLASVLPGKGK